MNLLARWVAQEGGRWRVRLALVVALFVVIALGLSYGSEAARGAVPNGTRSPVPKTAGLPIGPCETEDHALSVEIIDGVWFECSCEHMPFGKPVCDWYEITSPAQDPRGLRKWLKRHPSFKLRITFVSWGARA